MVSANPKKASEKDRADYTRPEYESMREEREVIRQSIEGTMELRKNKDKFLPKMPSELDESYEIRTDGATYWNTPRKTVQTMANMVMRNEPVIQGGLSESQRGIVDAPGPRERNLLWVIKSGITTGVNFASGAFFSDMAPVDPGIKTRAEERQRKPFVKVLSPLDIINWSWGEHNGQYQLTRVVLKEVTTEPDGEFGVKDVERYRVLTPGEYQLFEKVPNKTELLKVTPQPLPIIANGQVLDHIPVYPFSVEDDGDPFQARSPIADLTHLSIEHFQLRTDHKASVRMHSFPVLVLLNVLQRGKIAWGPSSVLTIRGDEADAKLLECSGSSLGALRELIKDNERLQARQALSMLERQEVKRMVTATETLEEKAEDLSQLVGLVHSVEEAINKAVDTALAFYGEPGEADISLNSDVQDLVLTPQEIDTIIKLYASDMWTWDTCMLKLQEGGFTPQDFDLEEEKQRKDEQESVKFERENEQQNDEQEAETEETEGQMQ